MHAALDLLVYAPFPLCCVLLFLCLVPVYQDDTPIPTQWLDTPNASIQ